MATVQAKRRKTNSVPASNASVRARRGRPAKDDVSMADRRSRIIEVATRRFAETGFEATTVRQIADDVNILSGSLYYHFDTKDDILHAIVRDAIEQMRDNAVRISKAPVDAEHRLVALVMLNLGELTRNQRVYAILYHERKFFRGTQDFAYVVKAKKEAYLAWKAVFEDGIRDGLFDPHLDIYLTITTILRMLNMAADWYRNDPESVDLVGDYQLDQLQDFHLNFALRAVRPPHRIAEPIPRKACEELARFRN
jgi:TetR/AcrR family transcriptional regulator, cholesterol catabolism regulator